MPVNPAPTVRRALMPLATWWLGLAARERRLLSLAGAVLGLYLLWALALAPAWRTLARAPAELDALDAQLQTMHRLAAEVATLRATPPVNAEAAEQALKAATERLGDKGRLALQGDRAVLTLSGASPEMLRDWLSEARSGARARPVQAGLARGDSGFTGTLTVVVGGVP